ncbi:MAG: flavin reductase family protein [Propionicimonas sp.]
MTIHREHPFADPQRDVVRQLRGRLAAQVTLWATGADAARAGLTVSSLMVANGTPARVLGLLDPLSDLVDEVGRTQTVAVTLLRREEHYLSEVFAGLAPAPGGRFGQATFEQTPWGPVLAGERSWAGLRLETAVEVGWSLLFTGTVEHVEVVDEDDPLVHHRGRYQRLTG